MISVNGLTKRFRDVLAVDGVSFDVGEGELFGLVGPDGAGKTTLLRMLAGVLRPDDGEAELDGVSVVRDPEDVKHHLAYMPQRFGLYTDLTVRENLSFYADLYRVPRRDRPQRLERLFQFSQLGPFQDRLAGQLSGGMKQKLGLSCALIHQPRILLLDEPTFGVDPISRRDLWLIVHEMVAQGVTAVVSTAYMDEAERFDRVALLHRGRVLALDTPTALRGTLSGTLHAVRVDERARDARELLTSAPGITSVAVFGDRLHVVTEASDASAIRAALAAQAFTISDIATIGASLEDVFMERIAAADTDLDEVAA